MGSSSSLGSGVRLRQVGRVRLGCWVLLPDNRLDGCPVRPARVVRRWGARWDGDEVGLTVRFMRADGRLRRVAVLWLFPEMARLEVLSARAVEAL